MKRFRTALAAVVTLALGGCAWIAVTGSGANDPAPPASPAADHPSDLVGDWRVTGGPGEGGDSWVRFDQHTITVWRYCGIVEGSWRANDEMFVADTSVSYGEGCVIDDAMVVDWLTRVQGYTTTDAGIELLDASGAVVTTLVDDGSSPPPNPYNTSTTGEPELTPEIVAALEPGRPLPAGAVPATDIVGRWIAADATSTSPDEPYVEFFADGSYTATEGCNTTGGRWALGEGADFLATVGSSTEMGCDMIPIPEWVGTAASIGTTLGETDAVFLTLYDKDAQPLGRLISG